MDTKMTSYNQNKTAPIVLLSILYEECLKNGTRIVLSDSKNKTALAKLNKEEDFGAVMYIISVLVFYSLGIVVMIIKYLRTEKEEMEEEAALENFFKGMPNSKKTHESEVNQVAIQAFHTLTSSAFEDDNNVIVHKVLETPYIGRVRYQGPVLVTDL